jgi:lipoic acid synthetase
VTKRILYLRDLAGTQAKIRAFKLHTVCEEARCPNRSECFSRGVATFLLLGEICTRRCGFCAIQTGKPLPPDPAEPRRVAQLSRVLGLKHIVLTSTNRDDLPDGGAGHFVQTIRAIREELPGSTVEVLTPDFRGDREAIAQIVEEGPEVFNHNVETVPRLYPRVRPGARYQRSLMVLQQARNHLKRGFVKSGIMVGHGERREELREVFRDLKDAGVDILTIGQYFQPRKEKLPVQEYYPSQIFSELAEEAKSCGIRWVFSGPYVRSSYLADELFHTFGKGGEFELKAFLTGGAGGVTGGN